MARRAISLLLALLPAATYAFADTHPVVAFATYPSTFPSTLKAISKSADTPTVLEGLFSSESVCAHDAVILVDQRGLHASDLRALSPDSALSSALGVASDSVQVPYLPRSVSYPFANLSGSLARRCGASVITHELNQPFSVPEADGGDNAKYVVHMSMPSLEGLSGAARKKAMNALDADLFLSLSTLSLVFQNYVVVYAGWVPSRLSARQSPYELTPTTAHTFATPSGGVLARYQLLTPGLILALLVGFFVLVPIIFFGISALASIQSPLKSEPPKGFVAGDKKNQ